MYAGCAGKTVRSLENTSYLSTLEVCSRQCAIQIHVYLTLPYLTLVQAFQWFIGLTTSNFFQQLFGHHGDLVSSIDLHGGCCMTLTSDPMTLVTLHHVIQPLMDGQQRDGWMKRWKAG